MQITVYDQTGKEVKKVDLNPAIFEVFAAESLLHDALVRQQANARRTTAKVKTRSERSGGGRKPWKQKGTGRARTGSIRSAQWRKGGRIFGPSGQENYSKNMPRKQRVKAILGMLSLKAQDKKIICLDKYSAKEIKTKAFKDTLDALPLGRSTLIALPKKQVILQKSAHNLTDVKVILTSYLNVFDLLKFDTLLIFPDTLKRLDALWGEMFAPNADTLGKKEKNIKPKAAKKTTKAATKVEEEVTDSKPATKTPIAKKTAVTKAAPKTAVKKAPAKKAVTAKKAAPKKPVAKKTATIAAKKSVVKKTTVKKASK